MASAVVQMLHKTVEFRDYICILRPLISSLDLAQIRSLPNHERQSLLAQLQLH